MTGEYSRVAVLSPIGKTKLPVDENVLLNSPTPEAMIILDADGLAIERAAEAPKVRLFSPKIRLPVFNVSAPATEVFPLSEAFPPG